jgi:hypothetical protein
MTFAFLKFLLTKLITSKSILIQFEGRDHLVDNSTEALILKINRKKFLIKLFYAPSLVLAEGYMDKDYELPNSSFYEFSELLIDNYNLYLEKFSRTFFQGYFL